MCGAGLAVSRVHACGTRACVAALVAPGCSGEARILRLGAGRAKGWRALWGAEVGGGGQLCYRRLTLPAPSPSGPSPQELSSAAEQQMQQMQQQGMGQK